MSRPPSQAELLERAVRRGLVEAHVSLPAEVVAVDVAKNLVDVKPRLRKPSSNAAGELVGESLPVIRNVPIAFPGAGGMRLTFPVKKGDTCLLIFTDYALDSWKEAGAEVDPIDVRAHHLTDAVAWFGVEPVARARAFREDAATLGTPGLQVAVTESVIELGGTAEAVAIASKVAAQLSAIETAILNSITAGAAGFLDGGVSFRTALQTALAAWPADVGSLTVKAKD